MSNRWWRLLRASSRCSPTTACSWRRRSTWSLSIPVQEHLAALQKLRKRLGKVVDTGALDSEAIELSRHYSHQALAEAKKKLAKHLRKLS